MSDTIQSFCLSRIITTTLCDDLVHILVLTPQPDNLPVDLPLSRLFGICRVSQGHDLQSRYPQIGNGCVVQNGSRIAVILPRAPARAYSIECINDITRNGFLRPATLAHYHLLAEGSLWSTEVRVEKAQVAIQIEEQARINFWAPTTSTRSGSRRPWTRSAAGWSKRSWSEAREFCVTVPLLPREPSVKMADEKTRMRTIWEKDSKAKGPQIWNEGNELNVLKREKERTEERTYSLAIINSSPLSSFTLLLSRHPPNLPTNTTITETRVDLEFAAPTGSWDCIWPEGVLVEG
ncbi:hypothetical protein KCU89_g105, partial [Aureobasidium melanogenum]